MAFLYGGIEMIFLGLGLLFVIVLFIYCACVVSGRCSKSEGGIDMSILQEYEQIKKKMGVKYSTIEEYLNEVNKNNESELFLSDILYKKDEFEKFDKWFKEKIKPFQLYKFDNKELYSVSLDQINYWYDWKNEIKDSSSPFGDGHCYNDAFNLYLSKNKSKLNDRLNYDSENGMFSVYCNTLKDAEEVAYTLSKLYKNEKKMINLIKDTKSNYGYSFDIYI